MQKSRSIGRVVGAALAVLLLVAAVAVVANADLGRPRRQAIPKVMGTVLVVRQQIERCADSRTDGRYDGGDEADCLDMADLEARQPGLAAIRKAGFQVLITSVDAGKGYVVQVGSQEPAPTWFAITQDAFGNIERLCSHAPIGTPGGERGAKIAGCDGGHWRDPRNGA